MNMYLTIALKFTPYFFPRKNVHLVILFMSAEIIQFLQAYLDSEIMHNIIKFKNASDSILKATLIHDFVNA